MMKFAGEVGEEIHVFKNMLPFNVGLSKEAPFVKGDFGNRRFKIKGRIPGAALGPMKTAPIRPGVAERCVHDLGVRNTK